jgi:hypothetical protein
MEAQYLSVIYIEYRATLLTIHNYRFFTDQRVLRFFPFILGVHFLS